MVKQRLAGHLFGWTLGGLCILASIVFGASAGSQAAPERLPEAAVESSQEAFQGRFGDEVDVELVTVDVLVLDRQGEPVLDLEQVDFEVFDEGQEVELQTFRQPSPKVEFAEPTRQVKQSVKQLERRGEVVEASRFVVFFDQQNTGVSGGRKILTALAQALSWLPPQDEVMVVSFNGSVQLEMPFSTNRDELFSTIERVMNSRVSMTAELEKRRTWREIENIVSYYETDQNEEALPISLCDQLAGIVDPALRREEARIQAAAHALEVFARSLSGFDGRKVVLHVSDGISAIPAGPEYLYAIEMCDGTAQAVGSPVAEDATTDRGNAGLRGGTVWEVRQARLTMETANTSPSWQRAGAVAAAYDVTIYPVQASGLTGSVPTVSSSLRATGNVTRLARLNVQDPLVILAEETGGKAILNTNDFRPGLEGMLTSTRSAYVLGYAAPSAGDGKRHTIKVKTSREGVSLRYRKSYRSLDRDERVVGRLISALMYGNESNELDIEVLPQYVSESNTTVRVVIPLAGLTLLEKHEGDARSFAGLLTVFVAAQDDQGQSSGVRQQSIPITASTLAEDRPNFTYDVKMEVPLQGHQFAVAVRDEFGGQLAFVRSSAP